MTLQPIRSDESDGADVVEGHVNRVKTLKRAMYGQASFELLRTRILTQP